MLMVNTLGYGAPEIIDGESQKDPSIVKKNKENYIAALLNEVIPRGERQHQVSRDPGRAIAGLSMGGAESLSAGSSHLDEFAWIGAFSTAASMLGSDFSRAFPHLGSDDNSRIRLLWIPCGTDDDLLRPNRQFEDWLTGNRIHFTRIETPGGPHMDGLATRSDPIRAFVVSMESQVELTCCGNCTARRGKARL